MFRAIAAVACALAIAGSARAQEPPIRQLSAAEAVADVALMRRALETVHPGLYRHRSKSEIARAFTRLERVASRGVSDAELYRAISEMLAQIRCNHTKAEQTEAMETWRRDNPSHLPFRFRLIGGRMYVISSDPAQSALPAGSEVLSIGGRPVARLIRTLGAYVPIDGETVWARATGLASDSDLMGADFDHFAPYVYGFTSAYPLRVRKPGARTDESVVMAPVSFKAWRSLSWPGASFRAGFGQDTTWRMLDPHNAYLRIPTFVNYRKPVDPKAFYDAIFRDIAAAAPDKLIIDLRENGGGSGDANVALAQYLLDRPFVWNRALRLKAVRYGDLTRHMTSWGDPKTQFEPDLAGFTRAADGLWEVKASIQPWELGTHTPSPLRFRGEVVVLSSPANGSSSTMLIAKLKDEGRVLVVGEPSGGSADGPTAGTLFFLKLPASGITVRVPNSFNQMAVNRFKPGRGVWPDLLVAPTAADVFAGRDPALEAALKARAPRL